MGKSSLANATRYSYLVNQQVDIETQQIDSFSGCVMQRAEADPSQACIDIVSQPGNFDLYSAQDKADACQVAVNTWTQLKNNGADKKPDVCAILTSHVFQAYSWYL